MRVNEEARAKGANLLIDIGVIVRTPGMGGRCGKVENSRDGR